MTSVSSSYMSNVYSGIADRFSKRIKQNNTAAAASETPTTKSVGGNESLEDFVKKAEAMNTALKQEHTSAPFYSHSTPGMESELALYWSIPSCMGPALGANPYDASYERVKENPELYDELRSRIGERQKDVSQKYELDGLTRPEFFYKTNGPLSEEMTDYFYNGFDDRGKELISFFFPDVANRYGFQNTTKESGS